MAGPCFAERWASIGAIRHPKIYEVGDLAAALVGESMLFLSQAGAVSDQQSGADGRVVAAHGFPPGRCMMQEERQFRKEVRLSNGACKDQA
jgi:hypothetical protein